MSQLPNAPIPDSYVPQTEALQIGDHKLSISCGVVERPDHHCGDDLVEVCFRKGKIGCELLAERRFRHAEC